MGDRKAVRRLGRAVCVGVCVGMLALSGAVGPGKVSFGAVETAAGAPAATASEAVLSAATPSEATLFEATASEATPLEAVRPSDGRREELRERIRRLPSIGEIEADESLFRLLAAYWEVRELLLLAEEAAGGLALTFDMETGWYDGLEGIDAWRLYELSEYIFDAYEAKAAAGAFAGMATPMAANRTVLCYELPRTGGTGIFPALPGGLGLLLAAALSYKGKMRRERK